MARHCGGSHRGPGSGLCCVVLVARCAAQAPGRFAARAGQGTVLRGLQRLRGVRYALARTRCAVAAAQGGVDSPEALMGGTGAARLIRSKELDLPQKLLLHLQDNGCSCA